jgi:hypothetical protein
MQSSRNASSFHALSLPDLGLQGSEQLREMAVAFDPPPAWLDEDRRTVHPSLFLVRRAPGIHLAGLRSWVLQSSVGQTPLRTHRRETLYPCTRFIPLQDAAPYCLANSSNTLRSACWLTAATKRAGKEEHLLSWPFLNKIPKAARIGDRQITHLIRYVQQVFVPVTSTSALTATAAARTR